MDSKNMYKSYVAENVSIDHNSFLTSSKGLVEKVVCSRALTSETPLEVDSVCTKQTANLPVASQVFILTNTTFLLVKRGTPLCLSESTPNHLGIENGHQSTLHKQRV